MGTGNNCQNLLKIHFCQTNFFKCSLSCNGGLQRRNAYCMSDVNGIKINEKYCGQQAKEILERTCNNEDCPTWTYTADSPVIKKICNLPSKYIFKIFCSYLQLLFQYWMQVKFYQQPWTTMFTTKYTLRLHLHILLIVEQKEEKL